MLEPDALKGARPVLRGGGAGDSTSLPDPHERPIRRFPLPELCQCECPNLHAPIDGHGCRDPGGGQPHTSTGTILPGFDFLPKNKEISIIDAMISVHLKAMRSCQRHRNLSQKDRTATVYRFLWLASGEHPICIRLNRTGETFKLHNQPT